MTVNTTSLNAINDRITAGLTVAVALLYQKPPVACPFTMISAASSEYECQFSSGLTFPVAMGARVTVLNQGTNSYTTDMFIVAVTGQPNRFRLTSSSAPTSSSGNDINGVLGASATVQEKPIALDLDPVSKLVNYEVNSAGLARQTTAFNSTSLVSGNSVTTSPTVSFPNSGPLSVPVSHVLTLVGGTSTFKDVTNTYHNLSATSVTSMASGDALTVKANQTLERLL